MRVVAAAVIRRRRPRTRVPPRVLSVRLLRVARARCARVPADELRALELELGELLGRLCPECECPCGECGECEGE